MSSVSSNSIDSERTSNSNIEDAVYQLSDCELQCARIEDSSTPDEKVKLDIVIPSPDLTSSIRKDFENRNKSCFQRRIMPLIVIQEWLGEMFDWNSKQQWSKNLHLSSSRYPGTLSFSPEPDFSISFKRNSFTEYLNDPIPSELEECFSSEVSHRCFPFLFFETDHKDSDRKLAFRRNLGTTALALKSMYEFMVRAGEEERFFEGVRVHSFVLNPGYLNLRQHRAEKKDGQLTFHFEQLLDFGSYTQSQAILLSKKFVEYAAKELHSRLLPTFKKVSKQTRLEEELKLSQKTKSRVFSRKRSITINELTSAKRHCDNHDTSPENGDLSSQGGDINATKGKTHTLARKSTTGKASRKIAGSRVHLKRTCTSGTLFVA